MGVYVECCIETKRDNKWHNSDTFLKGERKQSVDINSDSLNLLLSLASIVDKDSLPDDTSNVTMNEYLSGHDYSMGEPTLKEGNPFSLSLEEINKALKHMGGSDFCELNVLRTHLNVIAKAENISESDIRIVCWDNKWR